MKKFLKAAVFSDLHLSFDSSVPFKPDIDDDVDVVIVAGDVSAPVANSMKWLHDNIAMGGREVVFVPGNHEHYGCNYKDSMEGGYAARQDYRDVHFLENSSVVIQGVRFLGASMWTDFELHHEPKQAMKEALRWMNDYKVIHDRDEAGKVVFFTPEKTRGIHMESRAWLNSALAVPHDGPTVVVTHHCPHYLSIHKKYSGQALNSSFASDFSSEIARFQPEFWIHGHTHSNFDYVVPDTRTRVVCNPRGYVKKGISGRLEVENREFNPKMVIEIPLPAAS